MTDLLRKYKGKTYRDIEWSLRYSETPEVIIIDTLDALRKMRAEAKKKKLANRAADIAWGEIIEALQHERRIVRTMVRYKTATPAPERDEFVANYNAVLTKTYGKLTMLRREAKMPEHQHWTDYVPEHIKEAFTQAAADIPPRNRAKMKQPFERTIPMDLNDKRRARLLRRTRTELQTAKMSGDAVLVDEIEQALEKIKALPNNAHVPNTRHGLDKG